MSQRIFKGLVFVFSVMVCQCTIIKLDSKGNDGADDSVEKRDDCHWSTSAGYSLDLSGLYGATIEYTDISTDTNYVYTPCNNGVVCEQNTSNSEVMASQENSNGFCTSYLAKFDASVIPVYAVEEETFTFEYYNGEISGICDENREFIVQWQCTDDRENLYKVLSATEVASCVYLMEIESYLACVILPNTTTTGIPGNCEFGMYDYSDSDNSYIVDQGWEILTFEHLDNLKYQFFDYYNRKHGIPTIMDWTSTSCCYTFQDNTFLRVRNIYEDVDYDYYPVCPSYNTTCTQIWNYYENDKFIMDRLSSEVCYNTLDINYIIWNATVGSTCSGNDNNPGLYVRNC